MLFAFDAPVIVINLPISSVSNNALAAEFVVVIVLLVAENATLVFAFTAVLSSCGHKVTSVYNKLSTLFEIQHSDTRWSSIIGETKSLVVCKFALNCAEYPTVAL